MHIPVAKPMIGTEERDNVTRLLRSAMLSQGQYTGEFEKKLAAYVGTEFAVGTNSGTSALHIALLGLGAKSNTTVLTSALSFVATPNAISYTGAKPAFVDVGFEDLNISFEKLQETLEGLPDVVGVVPVHLMGVPADIYSILDWASAYELFVVEDSALALGTRYKTRMLGTIADAGIYSFYGSKTIVTGEGGMLVTNNEELNERMRLLRSHGQHPNHKYFHTTLGYSYQLSNLHAAVGIAQMEKIDEIVDRKRYVATILRKELLTMNNLSLFNEPEGSEITYFGCPFLVNKAENKHRVLSMLAEKNIETRPIFCVLPELCMYAENSVETKYPHALDISRRGFYISCAPTLTDLEIEYLIDSLMDVDQRID